MISFIVVDQTILKPLEVLLPTDVLKCRGKDLAFSTTLTINAENVTIALLS